MPLPDLSTPAVADVAAFGGGEAGTASRINYDVPLPGAYSWQRITPLAPDGGLFNEAATRAGTSMLTMGVVQGDQGVLNAIDTRRLASFYRRALPAVCRPSLRLVAEVGAKVQPLLDDFGTGADAVEPRVALLQRRAIMAEPEDVDLQGRRVDSYLQALANVESGGLIQGAPPEITLPVRGIGSSIRHIKINPVAFADPRVAIVETWELRSYLGDYGLGRTLQTFSLLPGERTTITVQTWRTEAATREDATSIFDSSDTAAQTRFTDAMQRETGSSSQESGGWNASVATSVHAGAGFLGFVSVDVDVSAGFAANHQEASQRFSNQTSQSASEHASQVNNSRRQSVDSSSTSSTAQGAETTTVREIANTNLRRVLNFVFRELNQSYDTYICLRDIQIAFYNGNPRSAEVVPLPEIARLIKKYIQPERQQEIARALLSLATQRIDAFGQPVTTLQLGRNPQGVQYEWIDAKLAADGTLDYDGDDVLASDIRWRFKPGPLSNDAEGGREMRGVIMTRDSVTLRTDNLVVEALLGQADALDPYASAVQALDLFDRQATIEDRQAQTRRTTDALAVVAAQPDAEKVNAWQKILLEQPGIEVVPAAAVVDHG